ncbi:DivIVA domain-containing protein [Mycolicibacterium iranicum]|uniref:DivIVA domain-containing protein n=1 Tax=Mycolicibacterium iranicum TaxID=912594 RepID=A0A839Q215_MYCIR|nr:DivIVA domain-containing protein [Mycolicibacterium iranicum]MBB2988964.1 DivIVA domain-containing protein [Mycolicibacterium iranicum]
MSNGAVTAEYLRSVTFEKPPLGKRGYNEKAVADFVALCARRLEGRGHLTADDVRNVRFNKPPFGRRGYHEDQVDSLLDEIAAAIDELDD